MVERMHFLLPSLLTLVLVKTKNNHTCCKASITTATPSVTSIELTCEVIAGIAPFASHGMRDMWRRSSEGN